MQLTLLFVLALFSCKKENLNNFQEITTPNTPSNPTYLPDENPDIQTVKAIPDIGTGIITVDDIPEHQLILEVESAIRNLTFGSLLQTAFYPQVYGLNNSAATTRTGCPSSSLVSDNSGSPAIHTITLDYGTGCTSIGSTDYQGTATVTIEGELNTLGTVVSIELSQDFVINSTNDLDGIISLEFDNVNGTDTYKIINLDLQNTNLQNSNITTISLPDIQPGDPDLIGGFFIKENTVGDPGNPLDIINDTLSYSGCFQVDSPSGQTLRSCNISNADINYDLSCGAPFDGFLAIDSLNTDGTFGDPSNPNEGTFGDLNFSYPNAINEGTCDNEIKFSDNVAGTSTIINF
ncbi:MAG: hypothetical protein AB8H03_05250 [Saprospiraceae bacterium]